MSILGMGRVVHKAILISPLVNLISQTGKHSDLDLNLSSAVLSMTSAEK